MISDTNSLQILFQCRAVITQWFREVTLPALKPCAKIKEGPLAVSCPQQWYEQRMKGPDWKSPL